MRHARVAIVLNSVSPNKQKTYRKYIDPICEAFGADVHETRSPTDAVDLAMQITSAGSDYLLAAGGDGTVNQVLNGVLRCQLSPEQSPVLGVIPVGSGNDFARNILATPHSLIELIEHQMFRHIDVGRIVLLNRNEPTHYFINEADVGMGPEVVKRVADMNSPFGSSYKYYLAILQTFMSFRPFPVTGITESWVFEGKIRTFVIANGKYYGQGLGIAPDAVLDDGKFRSFVCGDVSVMDFVRLSSPLKKCKRITHPKVSYNELETIVLDSKSDAVIEADGEVVGTLPARIDVLPSRIRLLMK